IHSRAVNGRYHSSMRRSLQSVALYEANRCLLNRYTKLRPFQRKWALLATAVDLLKTLDFLNDYQRQEIMFRTNSSKEPLAPDLAWRRMKLITREIGQTILPQAEELIKNNKDKSHDEICALLLQKQFDDSKESSKTVVQDGSLVSCHEFPKPYSPMWEYNHNNVFSVYRIYYRGTSLDPEIFPPVAPREVLVPMKKTDPPPAAVAGGSGVSAPSLPPAGLAVKVEKAKSVELTDEERRALLKEVKDHTELLREFVGVVPDDELAERKRALYAALPPVPPPNGKKQKKIAKATSADAAKTASMKDEDSDEVAV
ncbi:hypothetical protein ACHAXA_003242, partial [Cyclostephanos tholiformis]